MEVEVEVVVGRRELVEWGQLRLLPYLFFLSSLQNVFPLPEISGKKKKKPQKKEKKRLKERSYLNGQSIFKGIFSNIK